MLRFSCVPILISSLELLVAPRMLDDRALMSWEVGRLRHPLLVSGWMGHASHAVMKQPTFLTLLAVRALLATALLLGPQAWLLSRPPVLVMATLLFFWAKRSIYGQDGADQMQLIVWLAAVVALLSGQETSAELCLWFIAFQTGMAYCVAGFSKVRAAGWRRGNFLPGVLGTNIYGTQFMGGFLRHHHGLAFALSWTVLLFEMSFPLAWLLPWPWCLVYLVVGCGFHIANAFLMGLGSFLTTFLATYPALWFTLQHKGW